MCLLLFCFGDAAQWPLPRKLCLPVDHASDNGGRAAVLGLKLVMHGYFERVTACFLVVGHTHIDVDQNRDVVVGAPARNCHGSVICVVRGGTHAARIQTGDQLCSVVLFTSPLGPRAVVLQEVSRGGETCA